MMTYTPTTQALITTFARTQTACPEYGWDHAVVQCRLGYVDGRDLPVARIRRWAEEDGLEPAEFAIHQYRWDEPWWLIAPLGIVASYLTPECNRVAQTVGCAPEDAALTILTAREVSIPSATDHVSQYVPEDCSTVMCILELRGLSELRWSIPAVIALRDAGLPSIEGDEAQRALCLAVHATDPTTQKDERLQDAHALHRVEIALTEQRMSEDVDVTQARAEAVAIVDRLRERAASIDWSEYWP